MTVVLTKRVETQMDTQGRLVVTGENRDWNDLSMS